MAARRARAQMGLELYASDRTRSGFASVHRGASGLVQGVSREATSASNALSGAIVGNVGYAVAAAGAAFVGMAVNFAAAATDIEKRWAEVTTLLPNLTKQATDRMRADMLAVSKDTGFAAADVTRAYYQALSAGVGPGNVETFIRDVVPGARAGLEDLGTATDFTTSVVNAFNLEWSDTTTILDEAFEAVRLGKTTFSEMSSTMAPILPLAASLNTEFRELTAASAAITAQGTEQALASTQLRSALVALSKDTEAKSMFEAAMGMTYNEFQTQGGTLQEALSVVVDEANKAGTSIPAAFGRIEGAQAALSLSTSKGAEIFKDAMDVTEGAAATAAQKIEDTFATKAEKVKTWWENIKVTIGGVLIDIAGDALTSVGIIEAAVQDSSTYVGGLIQSIREELGVLTATDTTDTAGGGAAPTALTTGTEGTVSGTRNPWELTQANRKALFEAMSPDERARFISQAGGMGQEEVNRFRGHLWDAPTVRTALNTRLRNLAAGVASEAALTNEIGASFLFGQPDVTTGTATPGLSSVDRLRNLAAIQGGTGQNPLQQQIMAQTTTSDLVSPNPAAAGSSALTVASAVADIAASLTGGGGSGGATLKDVQNEVKGLRDDLRTGVGIEVRLDAQVDEGVIVRADTQERITTQAAAGIGYRITDRVGSG